MEKIIPAAVTGTLGTDLALGIAATGLAINQLNNIRNQQNTISIVEPEDMVRDLPNDVIERLMREQYPDMFEEGKQEDVADIQHVRPERDQDMSVEDMTGPDQITQVIGNQDSDISAIDQQIDDSYDSLIDQQYEAFLRGEEVNDEQLDVVRQFANREDVNYNNWAMGILTALKTLPVNDRLTVVSKLMDSSQDSFQAYRESEWVKELDEAKKEGKITGENINQRWLPSHCRRHIWYDQSTGQVKSTVICQTNYTQSVYRELD